MKDFIFHNPTKIIFGRGVSAQIGKEAAEIGTKALLVYGKNSIKASGLYERVTSGLKAQNISFVEHGGVQPNPLLSHAREGVEKIKAHQLDFIIAVGGGSVIDEAKAIAASAASKQDIWDFFTLKAPITEALPLMTVLTVPATGSEMNAGMVITNDETKDKLGMGHPLLYPRVSLLDPELTFTLPLKYTAFAAVDVVSHLTESYFNNNGGWIVLQQNYVEAMVKTVMAAVDRLLQNPEDYEARATFMWAATLGWNGLNTAGLGSFDMICHMLEHPISSVYGIAHGAGLSIVTPAWMEEVFAEKTPQLARFGREVFAIAETDDKTAAGAAVKALREWYAKIKTPQTFGEAGISNPDIEHLADLALTAAKIRGMNLNREFVLKIYRRCL